ncbi:MAG: histidine kinase dimerization/phospho-acceptor domain-containing protein, partial [Acidimicrobiia bacterium]
MELKRAKVERDAAQALAAASSDLVAHVSHDMRAPLNGILGMAQLLLEGELDAEQREFAELINSSGEALLTLINDLLDHSKIEAGKLSIDSVAFD